MTSQSATARTHRLAQETDLPAIQSLMTLSINELQRDFLTDEEIAASRALMGLDTQLIKDRTYFLIEEDGQLVGCGGWSWRATLFGGDHTASARDPLPLDPNIDPARIRAMYTHPAFARRGIGSLLLDLCEAAAAAKDFKRVELVATLAGEPLYRRRGYEEIERIRVPAPNGVMMPALRMGKKLKSDSNLISLS